MYNDMSLSTSMIIMNQINDHLLDPTEKVLAFWPISRFLGLAVACSRAAGSRDLRSSFFSSSFSLSRVDEVLKTLPRSPWARR